MIHATACLMLSVAAASTQPPPTQDATIESSRAIARALQDVYADVAEQVGRSVVCVTAYERVEPAAEATASPTNTWDSATRRPPTTFRQLATGSGLVIDQGVILTCRHPLLTSGGTITDIIDVETSDMQHYYAHVVGSEPTLNLAILKLEIFGDAAPPAMTPIRTASHEGMKPGHMVLAIADPFGAARTVTPGTCNTFPSQECYQADLASTMIQASLVAHPESLGGALATLDGEVIAMLMPLNDLSGKLMEPATGVTFALPIATALTVGQVIREKQSHESPWMGFAVLSMNELRTKVNDAEKFGAMQRPSHGIYIDDVFTPSPATASDLRVGDFLMAISGERISTVADFQRRLYLAGIGRTVELEIFRDGELLRKTLTIEKRPPVANVPARQ